MSNSLTTTMRDCSQFSFPGLLQPRSTARLARCGLSGACGGGGFGRYQSLAACHFRNRDSLLSELGHGGQCRGARALCLSAVHRCFWRPPVPAGSLEAGERTVPEFLTQRNGTERAIVQTIGYSIDRRLDQRIRYSDGGGKRGNQASGLLRSVSDPHSTPRPAAYLESQVVRIGTVPCVS